jgi:hypothetical protein
MTDTVNTTVTETAQEATITFGDLQNFLNVIDVAARRGAFAGDELTRVGAVRDKLAAFLEDVAAKNEAAAQAAQAAAAEATEAAPAKKPAAKKAKKSA